jgi:hypothetical protein
MTKILSVCVFMFTAVAICSPQDVTRGNWLLTSCQLAVKSIDNPNVDENIVETFRSGYCQGIVRGVSEASPKVCPGENVTNEQALRVVVKYLQDHPEELDQLGGRLVGKALVKAFPCRK